MYEELEKVRLACETCHKCPLGDLRTNSVFSDGVPNSKLMLIGEAPGYNEDMQGKPFVGRAGQLLDKIFEAAGLSREKDVYICNTLKCRPPENRDPLPAEKTACRPYVDEQIAILKPRIILLCGRVALTSFLPQVSSISKVRGQWFDGPYGSKMMPIFHPSYLLRNPVKRPGSPKALMWDDIREIKRVYDSLPD